MLNVSVGIRRDMSKCQLIYQVGATVDVDWSWDGDVQFRRVLKLMLTLPSLNLH